MVQASFETLIDSYIHDSVGMSPHFLSDALSHKLKDNLERLFVQNLMKPAGIGKTSEVAQDLLVRSDQIYWLDRGHNDPHEDAFFDVMDAFVLYLNSSCYTGITGYEFHYARYAKGAFYTRHLDQFREQSSRKFSMILYLNEAWVPADGGELCIHHKTHEQRIEPEFGKGVFFKSNELEHEVLIANKPRMSITGWLKVD